MPLKRWNPPTEASKKEARILKRVRKKRKLFAFLREHRHELFSDSFQDELEEMYRDTGAGKKPVAPAQMAMALLLQAYSKASDAEAVELAACDARWQLCLDCLGHDDPPFSQGALFDFRQRLIDHDLDRRLLERTVELARESGAFDWKKLPKEVRVAVDSSPLHGAGRVEDTINLLAHAAWKVVQVVAALRGKPAELVVDELGIPLLASSSVKSGLDVDWTLDEATTEALNRLLAQIDAMEKTVRTKYPSEAEEPPLSDYLALLEQLRAQDLEPDPTTPGGHRIRKGVAKDRRISIEDADMRHGRKSKTKAFNGYKRHLAIDIDSKLVFGVDVRPANDKEHEALPVVHDDIERLGFKVTELQVDRAYIPSPLVPELVTAGVDVTSKAWTQRNDGRFTKHDFSFNLRDKTVTCPNDQVQRYRPGYVVEFDAATCEACPMRTRCTTRDAKRGGRQISIHPQEELQERYRRMAQTKKGRAKQRERVPVEHRLAHLGHRQTNRARYLGVRKNLFDVRRHSAVMNLEVIAAASGDQNAKMAA
jgi:hypothetical protein